MQSKLLRLLNDARAKHHLQSDEYRMNHEFERCIEIDKNQKTEINSNLEIAVYPYLPAYRH